VSASGVASKTNKGELTLLLRHVKLLAPCLRDPPRQLTDPETRFRERHVDMRVNKGVVDALMTRALVVRTVRDFFHAEAYTEVETPVLWPTHGGAVARPFVTSSRAFGSHLPLTLRVAPELFLKQAIVGGMSRVFELGKVGAAGVRMHPVFLLFL
jgi:lysyl-tRNA synthetase class 2